MTPNDYKMTLPSPTSLDWTTAILRQLDIRHIVDAALDSSPLAPIHDRLAIVTMNYQTKVWCLYLIEHIANYHHMRICIIVLQNADSCTPYKWYTKGDIICNTYVTPSVRPTQKEELFSSPRYSTTVRGSELEGVQEICGFRIMNANHYDVQFYIRTDAPLHSGPSRGGWARIAMFRGTGRAQLSCSQSSRHVSRREVYITTALVQLSQVHHYAPLMLPNTFLAHCSIYEFFFFTKYPNDGKFSKKKSTVLCVICQAKGGQQELVLLSHLPKIFLGKIVRDEAHEDLSHDNGNGTTGERDFRVNVCYRIIESGLLGVVERFKVARKLRLVPQLAKHKSIMPSSQNVEGFVSNVVSNNVIRLSPPSTVSGHATLAPSASENRHVNTMKKSLPISKCSFMQLLCLRWCDSRGVNTSLYSHFKTLGIPHVACTGVLRSPGQLQYPGALNAFPQTSADGRARGEASLHKVRRVHLEPAPEKDLIRECLGINTCSIHLVWCWATQSMDTVGDTVGYRGIQTSDVLMVKILPLSVISASKRFQCARGLGPCWPRKHVDITCCGTPRIILLDNVVVKLHQERERT
ncbi:hypothetical protein PR048_009061 [Dryococelus australis]|uniref:Uncharacterized protein n=1 Tax=Dryococelus australis TaxID=614101 RepID=A0ABQ9HYU3_9NEOP|nr:hypothetical protein PR048_009061 [Dryococelus australis]